MRRVFKKIPISPTPESQPSAGCELTRSELIELRGFQYNYDLNYFKKRYILGQICLLSAIGVGSYSRELLNTTSLKNRNSFLYDGYPVFSSITIFAFTGLSAVSYLMQAMHNYQTNKLNDQIDTEIEQIDDQIKQESTQWVEDMLANNTPTNKPKDQLRIAQLQSVLVEKIRDGDESTWNELVSELRDLTYIDSLARGADAQRVMDAFDAHWNDKYIELIANDFAKQDSNTSTV